MQGLTDYFASVFAGDGGDSPECSIVAVDLGRDTQEFTPLKRLLSSTFDDLESCNKTRKTYARVKKKKK